MAFVSSVGNAGIVDNGSKAFGKSFGTWMKLFWTYQLGGDQAGQVDHVVFLPIPAGVDNGAGVYVGETDVTLKTGDKFVMTSLVWIGESYLPELNIPPDNPNDIPREWFTDPDLVTMVVTLDGDTLIDSE